MKRTSRQLQAGRLQRKFERDLANYVGLLDWLSDGIHRPIGSLPISGPVSDPSPARARCIRFIELLKVADLESKKPHFQDSALRHYGDDEVNAILALYPCVRRIGWDENLSPVQGFMPVPKNWARMLRGGDYSSENALIDYALAQWRNGSIQRLRTCRECKRWFYATTDHQFFCSPKCRQHSFAQGEKFKEKRKRYMRKHRREQREREERQLKRAGVKGGIKTARS